MAKKRIIHVRKAKNKFEFSEGQTANIILAARGKSGCPKANEFVSKIDKKYKLKKK